MEGSFWRKGLTQEMSEGGNYQRLYESEADRGNEGSAFRVSA